MPELHSCRGLTALLLLALVLGAVSKVRAAGISEIVVFGDSLSDQGNVNEISFGVIP